MVDPGPFQSISAIDFPQGSEIFGLLRVEVPDDDFIVDVSTNPCASGFQNFTGWDGPSSNQIKIWNFHFSSDGVTESLSFARCQLVSNVDYKKESNTCDRLTDTVSIQGRNRVFYSTDPFFVADKATSYPSKTWTDDFAWVPPSDEREWPFTPADDGVVKMIMHQRQEDLQGDIGTTGSAFPILEVDGLPVFDWNLYEADPQEELTLSGTLLDLGVKDDTGSGTYPTTRVRHYWQRGTINVP